MPSSRRSSQTSRQSALVCASVSKPANVVIGAPWIHTLPARRGRRSPASASAADSANELRSAPSKRAAEETSRTGTFEYARGVLSTGALERGDGALERQGLDQPVA